MGANTSIELMIHLADITIVCCVPGIEIPPKISPNRLPATGWWVGEIDGGTR